MRLNEFIFRIFSENQYFSQKTPHKKMQHFVLLGGQGLFLTSKMTGQGLFFEHVKPIKQDVLVTRAIT